MKPQGKLTQKWLNRLSGALMLTPVLLLQACASAPSVPYVYMDGSVAIKVRMNKGAVEAFEREKRNFAASGIREIMKTASRSDDEGILDSSLSENRNMVYKWIEYPLPASAPSEFIGGSGDVTKIELKSAWDRIYIEIKKPTSSFNKWLSLPNIANETEVIAIEPNFILVNSDYEEKYEKIEASNKKNQAIGSAKLNMSDFKQRAKSFDVINEPSDIWGHGEPGWHLTDKYSQLSSANEKLKTYFLQHPEAKRVLIAHLDTGFYVKDALMFDRLSTDTYGQHLNDQSINFTQKICKDKNGLSEADLAHGQCPGHGTETLSVLAGGSYAFSEGGHSYSGVIGANPYANTLDYRISNSVVHLFPKNMAEAIIAATDNKADVISLSAGGLPSPLQRDAVNHAYENGTAIFAATGDFFKSPIPLFGMSQTPSIVGFPARYNRVMAVGGTTYDYLSYGENPSWWRLILHPTQFLSWMLRGNFGPEAVMGPSKAVSAYAPNVLKAESRSIRNGEDYVRDVSLNGAGASHATPQVAGAASIWLQLNRPHIENQGLWQNWQKAEAVYQAVSICSADKTTNPNKYDLSEFREHFGAGHLKANDALNKQFPANGSTKFLKRPESRIGYTWLYDAIASTGLPINNSVYKASLMLEAIQFATIDHGLSTARAAVDNCILKKSSGDARSCQQEAAFFMKKLSVYPHLSKDLKDVLKNIKIGAIPDMFSEFVACNLDVVNQ